jgi:hypothetical protein
MSATFKLPKKGYDQVVVLNTPLATDAVLATGVLTLKDEAGNNAIVVKISDITGYSANAYAAGTANVRTIDFAAVTLVANTAYSLTIDFPNVVNFFLGGRETKAVYTTRTYVVSVDATPTVGELRDAFKAAIDADLKSGVTTSTTSGTNLRLTATSVDAGNILLTLPTGATNTNTTPYVEPVGTASEVLIQTNNSSVVLPAGQYKRYILRFRKYIKHNSIPGLDAAKEILAVVYANTGGGAGYTAYDTRLTTVLDGTYTPVADYLGSPSL